MVNYAELMKLREKATQGPWSMKIGDFEFGGDDDYNIKTVPYVDANKKVICVFVPLDDRDTDVENYDDDAAYICAACNAVPELVARIRELESQLYEAVGYIISNESQSMIDCRICYFASNCERGKDQCNPDHDMCRKAIQSCVAADVRKDDACRLKHARLAVEAEMIREGKGSGSPEVK